ncbi:SapC family protein [Ectothiorhodospira variabilis]|uniref:SapC family protein n=1 Tax=Ectothiorhodospira variabilis TaxID=505694 RepID=UPI001EFBC750|nr:SapC family protein [Ectothiorhodospira variabilis]MCG5498996.1 SapC family protein [Ectothiorhodospira variabilis]
MYKNLQPLQSTRHGQLRLNPEGGYAYAGQENFAPVFLQELPNLVREYFICFPNNQTDLPHVLLGFVKDKNAYVSPHGQWLGSYVPAYLRRYPFSLARGDDQASDTFTVALDEQADCLGGDLGEPLFTEQGAPSEALEARIQLLKGIEAQRQRTQEAVREIERQGLFKMEQLSIQRRDQPVANIGGLRMVDSDALEALDGEALKRLQSLGALELIHAHRLSLSNLRVGLLAGGGSHTQKQKDPLAGLSANQLFGDDDLQFRFDH